MNEVTTGRTYDLWSKVYDVTFGVIVSRRQRRAVEQLHLQPGDRVLDLGAGTGLMLKHYPGHAQVVAMDLSAGMIAKAADKCRQASLTQCMLVRGDAMAPPFVPHSFDHIMVSHTISVVSDPVKLLRWVGRLVKPGGRIVLLNHFQSTLPVMAWFEKVLNPLFVKLGWRSDLSMERLLVASDMHLDYCFKMKLIDLWRIVVLRPDDGTAPRNAPDDPQVQQVPAHAVNQPQQVGKIELAVLTGR